MGHLHTYALKTAPALCPSWAGHHKSLSFGVHSLCPFFPPGPWLPNPRGGHGVISLSVPLKADLLLVPFLKSLPADLPDHPAAASGEPAPPLDALHNWLLRGAFKKALPAADLETPETSGPDVGIPARCSGVNHQS